MSDRDTITLPREVVEQLLKMLEMVEPYADQLTDYSSTAAEWPLNLLPKKVSEAITALRTHLAAEPKQEPVAKAWAEGYQQGVKDERTSEASIGIAGFGAKVEPARQNPYGTALAAEQPKHPGYIIGSHWLETAYSRICAGEAEADVLRDCGWRRCAVGQGLTQHCSEAEALRRDAFRKGFYAGFAATGEGWNGEYPFQNKNRPIAGDPSVEAAIDAAMKEGT